MTLFEILIPVKNNKGVSFDYEHNRLWEDGVLGIAGGLTRLSAVDGQWISPLNEIIEEQMYPVRIACTQEHIEAIADFTAKHYNQISVMYYALSTKVIFKNYEKRQ